MENFRIEYVLGHIEVFDRSGSFCFSADTMAEVMEELREAAAVA